MDRDIDKNHLINQKLSLNSVCEINVIKKQCIKYIPNENCPILRIHSTNTYFSE